MRSLGHIKETKDKGVYRIVLSVGHDPATGKRLRQWLTVKGTRRDAEKYLSELIHEHNSGFHAKTGKTTVSAYLETWLSDYAKPNLSPKGFERYESIARVHLMPALGRIALTQLRPEHIQALYTSKLNAGLSARTVRYHHVVLHKALQTALKWGLVSRNVSDSVDVPKAKITEMQTWDESEVSQFLEVTRESQYYALFYTALFTGMRRSELLALHWQDVDFIYSQIYVNRSLHHLKDGSYVFTQPKSAKSRRTIALPPSAILTLREHHDKVAMDWAMLGVPLTDNDLVFSTIEGKPLRPNTITRAWQTAATKAGVKVIRLHDARHSHASLMLKQGIHPKIVQERLGHATIAITLDTYSHVAPGLQEAAAQRFDEAFQKPTTKRRVEIG
jgi:integrase